MITNSELFSVFIYTFLAFVSMAMVLILFFYFSRKKIIREQIEKQHLEMSYQKQILNAVVTTQELERERIARDLHDAISSKLNVVSLNSHLLKTPNLSQSELEEITGNIQNLTSNALESSRRLAHDLFPPVFEKFGLQAGIEELITEFQSAQRFSVHFNCQIDLNILPKNVQLNIFRITQELLNNTLKHSGAQLVTIDFSEKGEKYVLYYADDGKGYSQDQNSKGMGMLNLESRINLLSGSFEIKTSPNHGFEIEIIF